MTRQPAIRRAQATNRFQGWLLRNAIPLPGKIEAKRFLIELNLREPHTPPMEKGKYGEGLPTYTCAS